MSLTSYESLPPAIGAASQADAPSAPAAGNSARSAAICIVPRPAEELPGTPALWEHEDRADEDLAEELPGQDGIGLERTLPVAPPLPERLDRVGLLGVPNVLQ